MATEPPKPENSGDVPGDSLLAEIRGLLHADHERTWKLISSLERNLGAILDGARLTATDDEHDPEGSTIAFERSQASALLASTTKHLAEVGAALARIADGTYGRCEQCARPIASARLRARPTARTCITCA